MANIPQPNDHYTETIDSVRLVRDSVSGEPVIKSSEKEKTYLPHPCPENENTTEGKAHYKRYKNGAEYDNVPASTIQAIDGAMFAQDPVIEIPSQMEYMVEDADGDGVGLSELMAISASECLQMNYFGLLAEFSDLSGVDIEELTIADAQAMNLRSFIKTYPRESIINWDFGNINGVKQLRFVVLMESEERVDLDTFEKTSITSYLLLALDEDGKYYQQKYVQRETGGTWSKRVYPMARGQALNYIPFEFCLAKDMKKGELPREPGYIYPIASKTLARYRVSADLKESMFFGAAPTSWSSGWTQSGLELFQEMTGRDHISMSPGAHNPLPKEAQIGMLEWNADSSAYFKYMERNAAEIRALGGYFDDTDGNDPETATAATIKAAERKGVISDLRKNIEKSFERVISYCAEFMGINSPSIKIQLNKEYTKHVLTAQDRAAILNEWQMGLISKMEALRQLEKGGILTQEAETIMNEAEMTGEA